MCAPGVSLPSSLLPFLLPLHASGGFYKTSHTADCPGEAWNKNGSDLNQNGGFSLRSITFTVGETIGWGMASVALSPCDACLTLTLPRCGLTCAVLGTIRRALTSYKTNNRQWWEGSPCRCQQKLCTTSYCRNFEYCLSRAFFIFSF